MDNRTMWAIRDARGLNSKEKVFLLITESRGELYGKWDRNAADMGLSKRGYYDARASLLAKRLLLAERRFDNTTVYLVNSAAFPYGEQDSHNRNENSRTGNGDSRSDETKKNTKKNIKEELEEEQSTGRPVDADNSEVRGVLEPFSNYKVVPLALPNAGSRDAAGEWACGFHGHIQSHRRHHMDRDRTYGALAAKRCWLREENKTMEEVSI